MNSMRSAGYTRLWIEANFDYYTHVRDNSNAARARFDIKEPDGTVHNYKGVTVNRYAYFNSANSVKNIWVFLNDEIWDWGYSTPAITVNPNVTVWFADEWSQWSNTDWFQMTKWACWFSKS